MNATRALAVICVNNFFAASAGRITDPVLPQIAGDFGVDMNQAALLATAFALPWVVAQPVFGPLGDLIGKTRVIRFNLVILLASTFAAVFVTDFSLLFASRVVAGIATAGVMPVGFALSGDLTPPNQRQVWVGRVVGISMAGQLIGAVFAGLIADFVGWRGVFVGIGIGLTFSTVVVMIGLRNVAEPRAGSPSVGAVIANYRAILSNPMAKFCYSAVFFEGIVVYGITPYIAPLLVSIGETRASIAGVVIACMAIGGVAYSMLVTVFLRVLSPQRLMVLGGVLAAAVLLTVGLQPRWQIQAVGLGALGFGFYMLHNCIQVQMLELLPTARGSAVSLHASSFFAGQALGPILYGLSLPAIGPLATTIAGGAIMIAVGILSGMMLYGRPRPDVSA